MAIEENTDRVIAVPAPTAWPMIMALGMMLAFAGLVTSLIVSVVGGVLAISGAVGWFRDVLPFEHRETVTVEPGAAVIIPATVGVDYLRVGELGNRAVLPLQIYPYSAGIRGGIRRRGRDGGARDASGHRRSWQPLVHDQHSRRDRDA